MRSETWLALPTLAALGLAASPLLSDERSVTVMMCGSGTPVEIPLDNEKDGDCGMGCHAICPRRKSSGGMDAQGG